MFPAIDTTLPIHVLLVDDCLADLELDATFLVHAGLVVRTESNPLLVQSALQAFPADVLVLDLNMFGCDGIELAAKLRQDEAFAYLPIVFLSSEKNPERQQQAIEVGGDDFLLKSAPHSLLLASVRARAKRWRRHRESAETERVARLSIERNATLATVLNSLQAIVYVADINTHEVLFANQYAREALGQQEIVGRLCWQSIQTGQTGPCSFCTNHHLVDEAGRPKAAYTWEFKNTLNGSWYHIQDRAIEWVDGRIVRLEIATDITERKQVEARLEQLTRLYAALNHCNQSIVHCHSETDLFNQICRDAVQLGGLQTALIGLLDPGSSGVVPAACFGASADQIIREVALSADADSPVGNGLVGNAIRNNRPFWSQNYLVDPRVAPWHEIGRRHGWGSAGALPIVRDGLVIGCMCLYASEVNAFDEAAQNLLVELAGDVGLALDRIVHESMRKRSEEALRLAAEELSVKAGAGFFEALTQGLVKLLRADYAFVGELVENGRFLATHAVVTPAGIAANLCYPLDELLHQQILSSEIAVHRSGAAVFFPDEKLLGHLDIEASARVSLLGSDNKVIGIIAVMWRRPLNAGECPEPLLRIFSARAGAELVRFHAEESLRQLNDELEQRVQLRTEQLLNAKEDAENANLAKSEFLSSMSHELRTPLNAILGFSQLMAADAKTPLTLDQSQSVGEILNAGQHLLGLINEVLDLARIESGRLDLDPQRVDVLPLVRECAALIRPLAESHRIQVIIEVPDDCCLRVDRLRLRQVLLNLLSNAIKYNRFDGQVHVTACVTGDLVRIAARDTGHGIPLEFMPRLFKPFERHESVSQLIEGTGIGLALCKRLMEAMGGTISVDSKSGIGTVFEISLPQRLAEQPVPANATRPVSVPPQPAKAGAKHTVLYVEDNFANLRLVQKLLARYPSIHLIDAPTAEQGIELARALQPDLILMDIGLPEMDGVAAVKCLQQDPATKYIPVIAISANAMPSDVQRARDAGVIDYLTKPLNLVQFIDAIKSALLRQGEVIG